MGRFVAPKYYLLAILVAVHMENARKKDVLQKKIIQFVKAKVFEMQSLRVVLILMVIVVSLNSSAQSCLVAAYPFDGNAADTTGNGNDGLVTGATLTDDRDGNINSAYLFDGVNDYIELNNNVPILTDSTEFTITAWAKRKGPGGGNNGHGTLFSQRADALHTGVAIVFHAETGSGQIALSFRPLGGTVEQLMAPAPADTLYHHYAAVLDGDTARIYLDGQEVGSQAYMQSGNFTTSVDYVDIGRNRINGSNSGFFNGVVDEMQFYNCALTAADIAVFIPKDTCLPEAVYEFNGNIMDVTGNGHNGSFTNATLYSDRNGNANSAYLFDGSDDYIELDNNEPIVTSDSEFTLMAWAKIRGSGGGSNGQNTLFIQRDDALHTGASIVLHADNGSGQIGFNFRPVGGTTVQLETTAPSDTQYHHYAAVLDGDTARIYLDGEELFAEPYTQTGDFTTGVNNVNIGRNRLAGSDIGFFNGVIDELQLYNCALTKSEIKEYADNITGIDLIPRGCNLIAFPNPTSGLIRLSNLTIRNPIIEVYTSMGRLVLTTSKRREVDLSSFPSGLYYLSIRNTSGQMKSIKVIKE